MSNPGSARRVKELGRDAGFDIVRMASAELLTEARDRYIAWIDDGRQASMGWIDQEWARRSADPATGLDGARSVICVGMSYWSGHRPAAGPRSGAVARYAWGRDYHAVLGERLHTLAAALTEEFGGQHRSYVDTGPLLDKALAHRAGLGWYGKNSNILTDAMGSFVLLGEIVTTLELPPDRPATGTCGSCRLCVVACPTGAIGPEYSVDSRKCISYLTIEHRGPVPRELRAAMGAWVFGCDICQDVCPPTMQPHLAPGQRAGWARQVRAQVSGRLSADTLSSLDRPPSSLAAHPLFGTGIRPSLDLIWLLGLSHAEYLEAFRGSSIRRAKVWMLRRNAAIALGNVADVDAIEPLTRALLEDEEPIVRGHAAWALGRLGERLSTRDVIVPLENALPAEGAEQVRDEIRHALIMVRKATRKGTDSLIV